MLCEKCNKAQATVHITEMVANAPGEMKKRELCEVCFSQSELAKKVRLKPADRPGSTAAILTDDEPGR